MCLRCWFVQKHARAFRISNDRDILRKVSEVWQASQNGPRKELLA
jgi:hypothetical protein